MNNQADRLERYLSDITKGDKGALANLYEDTRVQLFGFIMSVIGNKTEAEDVLQNTYIKIWEAAPSYTAQGKPMAWIFTIARNLARMRQRDFAKRSDNELWDVPDEAGATPEQKLMLKAAMTMLTDEEKEIVILHAVSGFKHREIAKFLDLPLSTVLSKYSRALKRLKKIMEEE